MSNLDAVAALDAIERLIEAGDMQPEKLAACQQAFDASVVSAEKGPDWPPIAARAHALAKRLDASILVLSEHQMQIKQELLRQGHGSRALRAYKPH